MSQFTPFLDGRAQTSLQAELAEASQVPTLRPLLKQKRDKAQIA